MTVERQSTVARCVVIAEAGVNHNGDIALAHRLVDVAADAGTDVVKFQTFRADAIATGSAPKAAYQNRTTGEGSQVEMLRRLELSEAAHRELKQHAEERGLLFASTAFETEGVDFLVGLGVPFLKVPSGEITNYPLLAHIASKQCPVILSTGMSTLTEVQRAVRWLGDGPRPSERLPALTVLHCVTAYPAPSDQLNLRCVQTLADDIGVPSGYSDHSLGIEMSIAAVALGASVIEKHFTLDRGLRGPDHAASLEPGELATMVAAIRGVAVALGDGVKVPAPCERENIAIARRAIVAARAIHAGEAFSRENLALKRPAMGVSAAQWQDVIGRCAPREFRPDELIEL